MSSPRRAEVAPVNPAWTVAGLEGAQAMKVGLGGRMALEETSCFVQAWDCAAASAGAGHAAERAHLRGDDDLLRILQDAPAIGQTERKAATSLERLQA